MNVLSLFDGMSCGQIALERAGVRVAKYYASELDKYAIKVTQANYPNTAQLGDVTTWREWDVDWASIDLLIGGSPCQGFSFAGKQLAFDDPRSMLFFVYVDILNHIRTMNPDVKFMLENVKMKKEFLQVITDTMCVEPVFINSNLVSAQNRQRWYWTDIGVIEQPVDKGVMLVDIIEKESDNFTFMSDNFIQRQQGRKCLRDDLNGKAVNLSAMEYVKNGRQGDYIKHIPSEKCLNRITRKTYSPPKLMPDKTGTLNTKNNSGQWSIDGGTTLIPCDHVGEYESREDLSLKNGLYRKLTPVECERLQTVPDNYTNHVSNTQRYKMLGNGWTVDVIAHIFKGLKQPVSFLNPKKEISFL